MAHPQQAEFCLSVKSRFPQLFDKVRVLDIGSLDINGNNRYLFSNYSYIGVDLGAGKNVDVVCEGHRYDNPEPFDVVISTECAEHDQFWKETALNMVRLLKSGGLYLFTCATTGRHEHGTKRTTPQDSPFSHDLFSDYYENRTKEDYEQLPGFLDSFSEYGFSEHRGTKDLYFWGIKK